MRLLTFLFLLLSYPLTLLAGNIVWYDGHNHVGYVAQQNYSPVVEIALNMFSRDMKAVTGRRAEANSKGKIEIIELSTLTNKEFKKIQKRHLPYEKVIAKKDAFYIGIHNGRLLVMGDNGRGTAYGILELSRMAGVSPWTWWGDVVPEKRKRLETDDTFQTFQRPSVEYRGIFINDEDWSLRPWAGGDIGPKTYHQLFELLLRLRANTIWPAMHKGTTAFFQKKGNRAVADSFDIYVGSSHCEPMLRNNVGEWNAKKMGDYNFFTNRQRVLNYWRERVEETQDMDVIYTLGMRGLHDGAMEGAKTMDAKVRGLNEVIAEQRHLLDNNTATPQVFIPYKEVLDIYENGLNVPNDVMLMWCDDNYGYMTRLPDSLEQQRKGGHGIYYHLSYWGRPHDYLWLSTTQPGLVYHEMNTAWKQGARRMWIANIHDPKVAAYQLSLFLDMAWNINSVSAATLEQHLEQWLAQQFGKECGHKLLPVMRKYYELTGVRKPEFMGWSQVEQDKSRYEHGMSPAGETEFNALAFGNELERYLGEYAVLRQMVENIEQLVRPELKDAFFATVKYPIICAADMAIKQLEAQESRQIARKESFHKDSEALEAAARSIQAWREIQSLTQAYNQKMAGGKWKQSMSMSPRDLPVFGAPLLPDALSEEEIKKYAVPAEYEMQIHRDGSIAQNAADYTTATKGTEIIPLLGHSVRAMSLKKEGVVTYRFNSIKRGEAILRVAAIPTQTQNKDDIRFSVSIDGGKPAVFSLRETLRSEQWKTQVLRGQALRELPLTMETGTHTLTIKALDPNVIIDQWMIDFNPKRKFYRFPL